VKATGRASRKHSTPAPDYDLAQQQAEREPCSTPLGHQTTSSHGISRLGQRGYNADYSSVFPSHLTPVNGTGRPRPPVACPYYGYALTPFENYLLGKVRSR